MPVTLDDALSCNSIHAVAGSPHAGKSTLLAHLVTTILERRPQFLGLENDLPPSTQVVYVVADRRWHDCGRWLELRGLADDQGRSRNPRLTVLPLVDDQRFLDMKQNVDPGAAFFEEFVLAKCKPGALVILDTASVFVGDVLRTRSVMPNIDRLRSLLFNDDIRLVLVVYGVKVHEKGSALNYAHLIDRIIGCPEFRGAMSTSIYVGPDLKQPEAPRHLQIATRRDAVLTMRVGLNGAHDLVVVENPDGLDELLVPIKPATPPRMRLLALLPPSEITSAQAVQIAAEHLQVTKRTAELYLHQLQSSGCLTSVRHGHYRKVEGN